MKYKIFLSLLVAGSFFISLWGHQTFAQKLRTPFQPSPDMRIVSLAPSITESLFALGLGPQLAGVTNFCLFPPEARQKAQIGGYTETNFEAVMALRPDLVVLLKEHEQQDEYLKSLNLNTLLLNQTDLDHIIESFVVLGDYCGRSQEAADLARALHERMGQVRKQVQGLPRPRTMITVMRNYEGLGKINEIYVVGQDGIYNKMLDIAGGRNIFQGVQPFPVLSREHVMQLDPEVIIDMVADHNDPALARQDWDNLPEVAAVKTGRVYVISGNAASVPGPRFADTVELFARLIHQEPVP